MAQRHPLQTEMTDATNDASASPPSPASPTAPALAALQAALAHCQQALAESQAREQMALRMAAHDALTGLPNRRAFDQQHGRALQEHARQAHVFCLLFIDLDGFKAINDELGHAAGDALLQVVGQRLVQTVRRDDFVGRLGGDEFVCLLPNLQNSAQARVLADKLVEAITAPCRVGRVTVRIGATVGSAIYPRDGHSTVSLLAHADQQMRDAKAHKLPQPHLPAAKPARSRTGTGVRARSA
jgi:diguanylate cyclase (GGDEF)-like protein